MSTEFPVRRAAVRRDARLLAVLAFVVLALCGAVPLIGASSADVPRRLLLLLAAPVIAVLIYVRGTLGSRDDGLGVDDEGLTIRSSGRTARVPWSSLTRVAVVAGDGDRFTLVGWPGPGFRKPAIGYRSVRQPADLPGAEQLYALDVLDGSRAEITAAIRRHAGPVWTADPSGPRPPE